MKQNTTKKKNQKIFLSKIDKNKPIIDIIDKICYVYDLDDQLKETIINISKWSYAEGSNDCYEIFKDKING